MNIMVCYPPLHSYKGVPLLSQNRQFQWFNNPTYIFPIIPASAATLLKFNGYNVILKDAIVEGLIDQEFLEFFKKSNVDIIAIETKTPVIKMHWEWIERLKDIKEVKIVLMGDHVSAFPEESFENSKVDFIITGGDYDFSLLSICDYLSHKHSWMIGGIYFKENNVIKKSGILNLENNNLDDLPFIDRELTKCNLYNIEYNIPVKPFMYIMSGRDCPYGKCKFCAWPILFPKHRVRGVKNVLDEIGILIEKYDVKEIFDDSGTFMNGKWLEDFCNEIINRGYNKKISFSCNMRFDFINDENLRLMKKANFRLLKLGLESGNQKTLDKICKSITIEQIINGCKLIKKNRLNVHLTMIIGYPWETRKEALNTLILAKKLMLSGDADILQSTIIIPYPGTPLFKEALERGWFRFNYKYYERYDMREPVLKTIDMEADDVMNICNMIYTKIFLNPKYILRHISKIRNINDIKYKLKGLKAVFGHIKDFKG